MVKKLKDEAPSKVKNIVISGTNFWNPGDDFVRDGVIKILEILFKGYHLNYLFYNFNQDFFPQNKFSGVTNMAAKGDLNKFSEQVDAVVIAGLSAGLEINDLYNWVIENKLLDRVYLIGAGYENDYVDKHISQEPAATIFKNARIITGRTRKKPKFISDYNLPYHHVNCPAILSVPNVKNISQSKRIRKIAFSIQLPHQFGIVNHSCDESMHKLAMNILFALYHEYEIEIIAHHKSEYFYFVKLFQEIGLSVPVIFSSFYQDMFNIYRKQDLIIATRLHACLYGNGHGIPGIVLNDTDRHTHCLDGFPHSVWVNSKERFDSIFSGINNWNLTQVAEEAKKFKKRLLYQYLNVLAEPFGLNIEWLNPLNEIRTSKIVQLLSTGKDKAQNISGVQRAQAVLVNNSSTSGDSSISDIAKSLIGTIAGDVDTKRRVLNIFNRLTKDYYLEENIENYRRFIQNRVRFFDAASFINWYAEHFKPRSYLEVGVRRGRSLAQVLFQSPATTAFGFDMWIPDYGSKPEDGIYTSNPGPEFVLQELRNLGCDKLPTLCEGDSHLTLPQFWSDNKNPKKIDLVFVDGDHTYAGAKLDMDICFQHLADGGALVFDDISHPSHPELEQLWKETIVRYPDCIFIVHPSGMGTGVAFKPPFDNLKSILSTDICCPSARKAGKTETNGAVNKSANANLPIHFFTIVLNGEPFIRYHIEIFKRLSFKWHWHIIEGVADLKHDTAWSLQNGGCISDDLHRCGLSKDGTTRFLDELERVYPENITIYRKPGGVFWSGKLEMVNTPLENITEECVLWQVDADELWTGEQIYTCRAMFMAEPDRTAAYYLDHFFVGEELTVTTIDTYGNNTAYEWLRTWRFKPGFRWVTHEPPRLCSPTRDDQWIDVATIKPFKHKETAANGLVFQHYAYATERQLRFKEIYYGYKNAIHGWRALQKQSSFPVFLREYFPWVKDAAQVDRISQNIKPLAYKDNNDHWQFSLDGLVSGSQSELSTGKCKNILFVRTDSIGDNILAMSMIPHIKDKYPKAKITVLCQEHIAELYEACPCVDDIVTFDKQRSLEDEEYRSSIIRQLQVINADITLSSVYSREPLTDIFAIGSGAKERIASNGNLCNISAEIRDKHNQFYSKLLPSGEEHKQELERHRNFLKGFGIDAPPLQPFFWITPQDEEFADDFYRSNNLQPEKTIALFAGAQHEVKNYHQYGRALSQICDGNGFTVVTFGSKKDHNINQDNLNEINTHTINLCGKTTLRQMAAILKCCRLAVGADTGISHAACAVGTPNVILLGGGHFGRFMPYSPLSSVVCLPLDCYNCNWQCPYQRPHCISEVLPDVITEAIKQSLQQTSATPRVYVQSNSLWKPQKGQPNWKSLDPYLDLANVEIIRFGAQSHSIDLNEINTRGENYLAKGELEGASKGLALKAKNYSGKQTWIEQSIILTDNAQPMISVITPSFNQGQFIEQAIQSVIKQNYSNFEYIIIDGGSSDNSVEIIKKYQSKIDYWVSEKDKGQSDAINKGLMKASGQIVNWLNADDYLEPDALFKIAKAYIKNPLASGWVGACRRVTKDGNRINVIYPNHISRENIGQNWSGNQFYQPGCFLNCLKVKEVGGVDQNLYCAMDLDLWIKLTSRGNFEKVEGIVANATIHSDAKTQRFRQKMHEETVFVMKNHGFHEGASNRYENAFNNKLFQVTIPKEIYERSVNSKHSSKICEFELVPKSILLFSDYLPIFDIGSSADRIQKIIDILLKNKFKITYVYFNKFENEQKYKNQSSKDIKYIFLPLEIKKYVDLINSLRPEFIWMSNLWQVSQIQFMTTIGRYAKENLSFKLIIDTMDFHYKKYLRKYKISRDNSDIELANKFLVSEKELYRIADKVVVVSESEKVDIKNFLNLSTPIEVIPNIHDIKEISNSYYQRKNLCFFGNFNVNHNLDAVKYFISDIFPNIENSHPNIEFHIFGSFSERYRELFNSTNVKVLGHVENLEELLRNYRVFVCPLTYGAGMKGKIGLSASVGLPIVTTSIGAEGFDLIDGEHCFIADDPIEFAEKCKQIICDPVTWTNFSIKSRLFISENTSSKIVSEKFSSIFRNFKRDSSQMITICIPTFNRSQYLSSAIRTALDQTYKNYKILVVDDGSDDNTAQVVKSFNDSRIRYVRNNENKGRPVTRNRATWETDTEYILWLDDDDLLKNNIIETYMSLLTEDSAIDIIYCNLQLFDNDTGKDLALFEAKDWSFSSAGLLESIINGLGITNLGSLIRKSLYEKIGFYNESFLRAQDYEFWSRAAGIAKFFKVNEVLCKCRKHSGNISLGHNVDYSYDSQVIRNIVAKNPLSAIFTKLEWSSPKKAKNDAFYNVAKNLIRVKDYYNAEKFLSTIVENLFSSNALKELIRCNLLMGRIDECEEIIRRKKTTQNSENYLLSQLKNSINKYQVATQEFEKCLKSKQYRKADVILEHIIKEYGLSYDVEVITAKYLDKAGKKESALEHYKSALQIRPDSDLIEKAANLSCSDTVFHTMKGIYERTIREIPVYKENCNVDEANLVSVIIPTYNRPEMLTDAIISVIKQIYKNFEIIVVNDGGVNVENIVTNFNLAGNVRYIEHEKNRGMAAARNTGIEIARGKYIAMLDDDDLFYPNHLKVALAQLCDDTPVIYTDAMRATYRKVNGSYQLIGKKIPYSIDFEKNKLFVGNISPINCFVFEKEKAFQAGLFDETFSALEDWEFFIRLSEKCNFKHIAKVTAQVNWRNDGTTVTSSRGAEFKKNRERIYKRYQNKINQIPDIRSIVRMFHDIWKADNHPGGPLVSIVILAHNQLKYTIKCLESIIENTNLFYELILVDNGSTDGTTKHLESETTSLISSGMLKIIRNENNRGFAAGNNQGIAEAMGDYILLMNNDIIVTPGWLERMMTCAERDPRIGIVGPMSNSVSGPQLVKDVSYNLTNLDGLDDFAAEFFKRNEGKAQRFLRVVGFCMLIKRAVIDKIGGLDTSYGLGNFEDDDFSLRAALAGFESWMAQDCFIHHFGHRTFIGAKIDFNANLTKNWEIFKQKWGFPADLQLGSKYNWAQILKSGFAPEKLYCPINQGNSKERRRKAVSSHLPAADRLNEIYEIYQKVQRLANDGGREEAVVALEKLLEMAPEFAPAHNDLGVFYYNRGDKEKALGHYERAARLEPQNSTFQKNLADFYFVESGRIEDALAVYNQVLENDAGDVEALMSIGLIYEALERREDAAYFYNRVLEVEPWNMDARQQMNNLFPN